MTSSSTATEQLPAPAASSRRWLTLVTVGLAQLMVVLDATVVNIALPSAQADLGFSDGDRQWVITAYSLAFGSLLLLGGRLSDLIGRKRAFIIGLIGFAAASALGGAAPDFGVLVAARALQGAFGALLAPTALAVLTTTFTIPRERARAFGVFGAIAGAGGAMGLLLGGILTEALNWRWNLYINVFFAAVAIVGAAIFIGRIAADGPRPRLDVLGTILVSGGLFGIVYGFANAETDGWDSPLAWGVLTAAGVLLILFVLWQRRATHPLLPLAIVLDRNRSAAYISILVAGAGMFGIFLFVTYYMQVTLKFSPIQTGLAFLPMIAMLVLAAQLSTNLLFPAARREDHGADRDAARRRRNVAAHATRPRQQLRGGRASGSHGDGLRDGLDHARFDADRDARVDRHFAGVASAMVNTSQQVGGSIGTALLNTIAATALADYLTAHAAEGRAAFGSAAVAGYAAAYWWGAGFFVVGAVLSAVLFRRRVPTTAAPLHAAAPDPEPLAAL